MRRIADAMNDAGISLAAFETMPVDVPSAPQTCQQCGGTGVVRYPVLEEVSSSHEIRGASWREHECHHCHHCNPGINNFRALHEQLPVADGANDDHLIVHREQRWCYYRNAMVERRVYASGREATSTLNYHEVRHVRPRAVPPFLEDPVSHTDRRLRAEGLLLRHLSDKQKKQYERHSAFEVIGGKTGKSYTIHYEPTSNVHCDGTKYCAVLSNGEPLPDQLLAQMLMIKHREDEFLRIAVRNGIYNGRTHGRLYGGMFLVQDDHYPIGWVDWGLVVGCVGAVLAIAVVLWAGGQVYDWASKL